MKKIFCLSLVIALIFLLTTGCSSNSEKIMSIYQMKDFMEEKEGTLIQISDPQTINDFKKAFNGAKKQPGTVNIADPDYKVQLGLQIYLLWVEERSGIIMNAKDTSTIYKLSQKSIYKIKEILINSYKFND